MMGTTSISGVTLRLAIAIAVGAAISAGVSSVTIMSLLTQATIYAVLATGLGVLVRQSGVVSFGHAVFFGATGYVIGLLLHTKTMPPEFAIAIGIILITLFALLYGLIIVRVPGVAFGMITLAVGQMFFITATRSRGLTGGADGMHIDWPTTLFGVSISTLVKPSIMFLVSWTTLVVMIAAVALLLRGHFGAITEAIRDNEERARFIGIRTLWPRVLIFALSGLTTAVGGALSVIYTGFISPESMDLSVSAVALMMVVVGGTRAQWGPALGAYAYFMTKDYLGDYADHWMAIFGIALIAVTVLSPAGIAGWLLALRNRILGPKSPMPPTSSSKHAVAPSPPSSATLHSRDARLVILPS